jgi:hypothetical protein
MILEKIEVFGYNQAKKIVSEPQFNKKRWKVAFDWLV